MNNQIILFPKNEEGSVLLIVAIFLPIALALLAISLNVGTMYYAKSAYTNIANTATASALSPIGDEMIKIINDKIAGTPPFIPTSSNVWENLTDEERIFLTTDPIIISKVNNTANEYLQKNISTEAIMRNDFVVKNITIIYPYKYTLSDNFVKVRLEFDVQTPISLISSTNYKNISIKAESQLRISP